MLVCVTYVNTNCVREYGLIAHCSVIKHENCFACLLYPESFDSYPRMSLCFLSQALIQKSDLILRGRHSNSSPFGCSEGENSRYYERYCETQELAKNCKIKSQLSLHVLVISDFSPQRRDYFMTLFMLNDGLRKSVCTLRHYKFKVLRQQQYVSSCETA